MLAAFAVPGQKRPPARDLDGLEDDVATLSYERALRTHARYSAPQLTDRSLTQAAEAQVEMVSIFEVLPLMEGVAQPQTAQPASVFSAVAEPEPVPDALPAFDRNLKSTSVTIRMSKAECAQLRMRAAEAGLTVSAYLRSCTFEAESLRALVKDTLAQLRDEPSLKGLDATPMASAFWFRWLRRLWPRAQGKQQAARA